MKIQTQIKLPFFTLLLMISFASVNAVLFTPALPDISEFFTISEHLAQSTITWFLIGYAIGQLLYGPLANRFGRKQALYLGVTLQIVSSLLCVLAGLLHKYPLLVIGRFLLALGSGVGLKMTFTLLNECYEPKVVSQKLSYIMLSFAIAPGLSIALGGFLNSHFGWMSCFYAGAVYGLILLFLVSRLPETATNLDKNALKISHLISGYGAQFSNVRLVLGGLLMGGGTCFVYVFAALAPFIAINFFGLNSTQYGLANLIPLFGLVLGSLTSARLIKIYDLRILIKVGIAILSMGTIIMFITIKLHLSPVWAIFMPMNIIYFGMAFIFSNVSTLAMSTTEDKAHGSAVMNFINMGVTTLVILSLGYFSLQALLLPISYMVIVIIMLVLYKALRCIKFVVPGQ